MKKIINLNYIITLPCKFKTFFCTYLLITCHQIVETKFTWTIKALSNNSVLRTVSS